MNLDVVIVGQGLAGTTLAWALLERGASILVIDSPRPNSASRVAAGLVTPVTGRALATPPDFARDRAAAAEHYRHVERATGASVWTERPALRLFATPADVIRWRQRAGVIGAHLTEAVPPPAPGFATFEQAALMPGAARLDVPAYLDASRDAFSHAGRYENDVVDLRRLEPGAAGVRLGGGRRARFVVLCGGSEDAGRGWLPERALSPAKGEILTVDVDDLRESRTTHRGGHWLLPVSGRRYRFGATYDHDDTSAATTPAARAALEQGLATMIRPGFRTVDQQAGVRPIGAGRRPVVGAHPEHPRIVFFNGLGSRGVLWAPQLARSLADALIATGPAPIDLDR